MYYSVRTSFQKRLIRRETINVRGGRVNEGRVVGAEENPIQLELLISSPAAPESLNRATSSRRRNEADAEFNVTVGVKSVCRRERGRESAAVTPLLLLARRGETCHGPVERTK